jgi:hypothetical protein
MARSSKLALVTLLAGLLSLASVGTVGADGPCTGYAREHCEQSAAQQAIPFTAADSSPTSDAPYTGIAREHYEMMQTWQLAVLDASAPIQVATDAPGFAFGL